jgi:hypothetical protein
MSSHTGRLCDEVFIEKGSQGNCRALSDPAYDDLVDHCCEAWGKLVDQPWRIMSIGLRQWAHGF